MEKGLVYKRILLKLSGEALMGSNGRLGIDRRLLVERDALARRARLPGEQVERAADECEVAEGLRHVTELPPRARIPFLAQEPHVVPHVEQAAEQHLLDAFESVKQTISKDMEQRDFARALSNIVALKGPVDAFFDDVMVMVDDAAIRRNRLSLLGEIAGLFNQFADFSKLAV